MEKVTAARYHPLQVTFHWLTVILVLAAFIVGKFMSSLPNDDASKLAPLALHMSIGILTLLVIVARFAARAKLPKPDHVTAGNAVFDWIGKFVHYALYLVVFLIAVSGFSLSVQAGLPPIVFGGSGAPLPASFFDFAARLMHGFIAPTLLLLVLLHAGAAFYHQFLLKDNIFARMWYGK
ncbi:MAG: cytochrome b [Chloroflexi bacterium CFX2]|nr:cytochrome b [Chloroflexi bacterium CFX2]